jgi:hypothetical protein
MQLFKFREEGGGRIAFVQDPFGDALPMEGREWRYVDKIDLSATEELRQMGTSAAQVVEAVSREGCFIWSPAPQ